MIATLVIILNLIILEGLLSIDNAAVLATMVKDLPGDQPKRALKWGMWGAYIGRGLCLLFAAYLVSIWWLKPVGGLYLIYLCYGHFSKANDTVEEASDVSDSKIFGFAQKYLKLNKFWATVVLVEVMDLAFSIDNVFAAVALTDKLWAIILGVFIGIAVMRFVAGKFVEIMKKHPQLEVSAYIVIGILGLKLTVSGIAQKWFEPLNKFMENHTFGLVFSGCMMMIFFIPLLLKKRVSPTP
jgi:YkoY family integral membrane protein